MLKLFFLGIGFVLVFEGVMYFVVSKKINSIIEIIKNYEPEKIRFFSTILILLGLCIIYFTLKSYN